MITSKRILIDIVDNLLMLLFLVNIYANWHIEYVSLVDEALK